MAPTRQFRTRCLPSDTTRSNRHPAARNRARIPGPGPGPPAWLGSPARRSRAPGWALAEPDPFHSPAPQRPSEPVGEAWPRPGHGPRVADSAERRRRCPGAAASGRPENLEARRPSGARCQGLGGGLGGAGQASPAKTEPLGGDGTCEAAAGAARLSPSPPVRLEGRRLALDKRPGPAPTRRGRPTEPRGAAPEVPPRSCGSRLPAPRARLTLALHFPAPPAGPLAGCHGVGRESTQLRSEALELHFP